MGDKIAAASVALLMALGLTVAGPTASAKAEPSVSCTTRVDYDGIHPARTTWISSRCYGLHSGYDYRVRAKCSYIGGSYYAYGAWKSYGSGKWSEAYCPPLTWHSATKIQTR